MAGVSKYKIVISIDDKTIDLSENIETNYRLGSINQLALLLYRGLLAMGFTPNDVYGALGRIAASGGYSPENDNGPQFGLDIDDDVDDLFKNIVKEP